MFFFYFIKLLLYKSRTVTINPISLPTYCIIFIKIIRKRLFPFSVQDHPVQRPFLFAALTRLETYLGRNLTNLGQNFTKLHKTCFFNKVRSHLLSKTSKTFILLNRFLGHFWVSDRDSGRRPSLVSLLLLSFSPK